MAGSLINYSADVRTQRLEWYCQVFVVVAVIVVVDDDDDDDDGDVKISDGSDNHDKIRVCVSRLAGDRKNN